MRVRRPRVLVLSGVLTVALVLAGAGATAQLGPRCERRAQRGRCRCLEAGRAAGRAPKGNARPWWRWEARGGRCPYP